MNGPCVRSSRCSRKAQPVKMGCHWRLLIPGRLLGWPRGRAAWLTSRSGETPCTFSRTACGSHKVVTEEILLCRHFSHGGCLRRLPARSLTGRPLALTAANVKPCPAAPPRPDLPACWTGTGQEVSPSPRRVFLCPMQHTTFSKQPTAGQERDTV